MAEKTPVHETTFSNNPNAHTVDEREGQGVSGIVDALMFGDSQIQVQDTWGRENQTTLPSSSDTMQTDQLNAGQ